MIITIDGPAAAGKGTVSKVLAERYHLAYFDTGMIYRAVGLEMVLSGFDLADENKAFELSKNGSLCKRTSRKIFVSIINRIFFKSVLS